MPEEFSQFESKAELRECFETADLSEFRLDQALEVVVATRVQLSVGDDSSTSGSGTAGATGTLRDPISLVRGYLQIVPIPRSSSGRLLPIVSSETQTT
jgi:hypothetical protein